MSREARAPSNWRKNTPPASRLALALGVAGLLVGAALLLAIPQRPDGDATALAHFDALHGLSPLHYIRNALWFNLAGALLAWGALGELLRPRPRSPLSSLVSTLLWLGLLLAWGGWAWDQGRGWQGELFLEPGVATPLGVDRAPVVRFEGFRVPPAPDGPGRALALRLNVDGQGYPIAEAQPWRGAGWTLTPRWYGATLRGATLSEPLFFGGDGTQVATLRGGGPAEVTLDVETLRWQSEPPLPALVASHHAIVAARFAPGAGLWWAGLGLMAAGAFLRLAGRRYNGASSTMDEVQDG